MANDDVALQRIKDAAEKAKCDLSSKASSAINIPYLTQSINLEMTITRSEYEQLVQHLIDRSITVVERAIREAGFIKEEINEVVLVGGQSRMPKIHQTLKEYFGIAPSKGVHPDEAVALGAALHAATLSDESVDGPLLIDVTPFDLGIDIAGGLFEKIIQRNTAVPTGVYNLCSKSRSKNHRLCHSTGRKSYCKGKRIFGCIFDVRSYYYRLRIGKC